MSFGFGIAAALAAPFVMTIGFVVWDDHWKGSAFALNLFKCCTASIGFAVLSVTTRDISDLFPSDLFTTENVGFLMLSSTIGIIIGDWTWLQGLQYLGARRVILMDSLKPFLAALFGWAILDENLRLAALGGISLTVVGILVVSLETREVGEKKDGAESDNDKSGDEDDVETELQVVDPAISTKETSRIIEEEDVLALAGPLENALAEDAAATPSMEDTETADKKQSTPQQIRVGYAMAILNVVLDTYGAVLVKQYARGMTVWEINLIRFGFAGVVMLFMSLALHTRARIVSTDTSAKVVGDNTVPWYALPTNMTRSSWVHVSGGVVLVTFLTPSLSNYALFQIALALALTLGAVSPLYALPISYVLQNHKPTLRACAGAVLAVAGIVVLAFGGTLPDDEDDMNDSL